MPTLWVPRTRLHLGTDTAPGIGIDELRELAVTPQEEDGLLGLLKPTATTCGLRDPGILTTHNGNLTLNTDGQLYENRDVRGAITLAANTGDVTIRNCKLNHLNVDNAGVTNIILEDSEVRSITPAFTNGGGVVGHDVTVQRTKISGHIDGAVIRNNNGLPNGYNSNVRFYHYWINKLAWWTDDQVGTVHTSDRFSHNDGIQHMGGWFSEFIGGIIDARFERQYGHWFSSGDPTVEPYVSVPLNSLPDGGPWYLIPDRNTGDEANGRYNQDATSPAPKASSVTGFLIGNNVGTSRRLKFNYNWMYGGDMAFNGGGFNNAGETGLLIEMIGNRFSYDQGEQGGSVVAGQIRSDTFTIAGFGNGWSPYITRSGNVYEHNGAPITYRIPT